MKNILLTFGSEKKAKYWFKEFDNNYFLKTEAKIITSEDISTFFQNNLISYQGSDNLFVIYNELSINDNYFEKKIKYIVNDILTDKKICYLWNYMQDCQKLEKYKSHHDLDFYHTRRATDFYAVAGNFDSWNYFLARKVKDIPLKLLAQNNYKDNMVYAWPPLFHFPLEKMDKNFSLSTICQENYDATPLKPYNNRVAKILASIILCLLLVVIFIF